MKFQGNWTGTELSQLAADEATNIDSPVDGSYGGSPTWDAPEGIASAMGNAQVTSDRRSKRDLKPSKAPALY